MARSPSRLPLTDRHVRARPFAALRRAVSWHRRKLAVLAAVVAVFAGVNAATPEPPATVEVLVAAHELAGGVRLQSSDVSTTRLPVAAVPEQAVVDPGRVLGRTVVAPLTRGTVLTELSVLSPRLTKARPGSVIVAVELADPTLVQLLSVGDRVDVLVATTGTGSPHAEVVAASALLVTVPAPPTSSGPIGSGGTGDAGVVLVEVDAATAVRLTQAAATGPLTVVLR